MEAGNNYPNPLDNFRSYSYHFILTVANTTEAFRKMIGDAGNQPLYSLVEGKKLGDELDLGGGEKAVLVIDTRRFSQFSITEYEAEHVYGTGDRVNPSVPVGLSRLKIIDTTGITFLNFMMDIFRNKIKSTRLSSFFLLNIMFVGHGDGNQQDEIISTSYIPFLLVTMSGSFTSSGSAWDLEFMEIEGAPGRGSPVAHVDQLGITQAVRTIEGANNLGGMLYELEKLMNANSLAFFQTYVNKLQQSGEDISKTGKLVQYMINIPDEWASYELTALAKSKHEESMFLAKQRVTGEGDTIDKNVVKAPVNITNAGRYAQISFSPNTTVTDAISQILQSCGEILKKGDRESREAGKTVTYKILTNITSDSTSYIVHYDVYPYYAPKLDKNGRVASVGAGPGSTKIASAGSGELLKNVIHYDYVFTGRNSHVEDLKITYSPESAIALDMNLELGSARFSQNASVMSTGNPLDVEKASKTSRKADDSTPLLRPGDPIFPTTKTLVHASNNSSQPGSEELPYDEAIELLKKRQEYHQTMAFLHFLGSIQLDMTVRGNPNIIKKYADRNERGGIAPHSVGQLISLDQIKNIPRLDSQTAKVNFQNAVSAALASARQLYRQRYYIPKMMATRGSSGSSDQLLNGIDVASLPIFVKVNIKAPNVDYAGDFLAGESAELFTDKFFFNGFYQVLTIRHTFQDGKFEHVMSMIPYDISGSYSTSGDTNTKTPGKQ